MMKLPILRNAFSRRHHHGYRAHRAGRHVGDGQRRPCLLGARPGDLGYDIYDIVVNKGVKGPLGFVGGVAAFLFGVSRLFSNIMIGIPTIVAAVCLIKADSILQTFGMLI
jgi:hypothetical protein